MTAAKIAEADEQPSIGRPELAILTLLINGLCAPASRQRVEQTDLAAILAV